MKARELLDIYKSTTVRAMLEKAGGPVTSLKKYNIDRLAPLLELGGRVLKELDRLDEAEKVAIARIRQKGDEISSERLKSILLNDGVVKPTPAGKRVFVQGRAIDWYEGNPDYHGEPAFEDLMGSLAKKALVFSRDPLREDRGVIEWTPGRTLFIPNFVARYLPAEELPELPDPAQVEPPVVVTSSARNFQRDLGRYGRYLRRYGGVPLTTQGLVYKKNLKEIAADLSFNVDLGSGMGEEENPRLYFIRRLLPKIGLAKQSYEGLVPAGQDKKFWQMEPAERVKRTFETWRDTGAWNELRQLPSYERGYDRQHDAPAGLSQSRKKVLQQVKQLGEGWIGLTELIAIIRDRDYGFLFPNRKHDTYWYYRSGVYTTPYYTSNNPYGIGFAGIRSEADGWDKVEAAFITHVIAGPMFWMGLVDLGYTNAPGSDGQGTKPPLAYRLTDLGAWLFGLGDEVEIASEGGDIVVQPNFEILAMEPISDEVLLTLDQFADSRGGDRVITYDLSRTSVYRGQRQQWPVSRIIGYLEKSTKRPLPDNVKRTLQEWDFLHQRITIRQDVNLLQTLNNEVRQQVQESPVGRQLRPATADVLLSDRPAPELARDLREAGWIPVQTPAGDTNAPGSVTIDEEGRVRYVHQLPSIYAQGAIAPLSVEASPEHDEGAQRRITPPMVKAVLRQGQSVDDVLAQLRRVHRGELPGRLIIKIKAWGNYYGKAQQETLNLIEFRDTAARDELLADPALGDYLTPFKAGNRALAVVSSEYLEEVNNLLAERGVDVTIGLKR